MGKNVITVDLNPLSRTAKAADVTIVDNLVRAMPAMVEQAHVLKGKSNAALLKIIDGFDNRKNLAASLQKIRGGSR